MLRPHPPNAFWTFVVPAPLHLPCRHWSLTIKISIQNRPNVITPSSWLAERCCGIGVQMAQTMLNISLMLCASHMFFFFVCVPLSLYFCISLSLPPSLSISLPLFSLPLFLCMPLSISLNCLTARGIQKAGEVDWAQSSRAAVSEFNVSCMFKHAACCLKLQRMPNSIPTLSKIAVGRLQ